MADDREGRKFLRAAKQRLTSAELLLEHEMNLDAMYLAGYGVECAMKALLLARTPRSQRRPLIDTCFRGAAAHSFESLKQILREKGVVFSPAIAKRFRTVASWSTDLRYEIGRKPRLEAEAFVSACRELVNWLEQQQ